MYLAVYFYKNSFSFLECLVLITENVAQYKERDIDLKSSHQQVITFDKHKEFRPPEISL